MGETIFKKSFQTFTSNKKGVTILDYVIECIIMQFL
nr:MAG TPA: hypothetical protein [Caudoviricetes sp.]